MKILVLGVGLVGGPIAADLSADIDHSITVADVNQAQLVKLSAKYNLETLCMDLSDPETVRKLTSGYQLVVSAVPGFMGHQVLKAVIESGVNIVDITFAPEDFQLLDSLAKENHVTAVCDMGVAPGMSHLLSAEGVKRLDSTSDITIYVGGLPVVRQWPYEYKAVFSPIDVIEEYTRPARFRRAGKEVVMPALSDIELLDFEGFGQVESFNSDGLRSLLTSFNVPNMIEKTLRYPGHVEKMLMLRETGFFSSEPVLVNGQLVRPIDVTAKLLFPMIKLAEGEEDVTIMQVLVEGLKSGKKKRLTWSLVDRYDPVTGIHSMARTTGYTATMAARLVAAGHFRSPGVHPPEALAGNDKSLPFILEGLRQRGVLYNFREEEID